MRFQDGVVVSIIVNCFRKKFNCEAAATTVIIFLLALPKFLGGLFKFSAGSFNAAKMSGSVKALVADSNRLKKAKMQKKNVKTRVVKKRVVKEYADDGAALYPAAGAGATINLLADEPSTSAATRKKNEEDAEGEAEADADGDDGGADGGGD